MIGTDLGQLPQGTSTLSLKLTDDWGDSLANGIYYLVFTMPSGKLMGKLLVLR